MMRISYFVTVSAAIALLTACESDNSHGPRRPGTSQTTTTIPEQKPELLAGDAPVVREKPPVETQVDEPKVNTVPVPPPAPTGNPDYAIKVPGKQGFVRSPYTKDEKLIDVRNLPPGTEVRDPYNPDHTFLVP